MTDYLRMSGMYWGLTALELVDKLDLLPREAVIEYIKECQDETSGGIGACKGHDPHLLYTLSAVQVCIRKALYILYLYHIMLSDFMYVQPIR